MQNPFRHQGPDDRERERDERRWEARDQRYDENRSWGYGGGDGGRTSQAYSGQGRESERYRGEMTGGREYGPTSYSQGGWQSGQGGDYGRTSQAGQYGSGERGYYGGQTMGQGYGSQGMGQGYGGQPHTAQPYGSQSIGQDYGSRSMGQGYGYQGGQSSQTYSAQGYAPGAEIWRGSDRNIDERGRTTQSQHDFEPDYLHWREQQLTSFDKDYHDWRSERRQKFSADFDSWRQSRPRSEASGEHHTPAANPIVGDVSDGGVGSAADAKKR